jgi:hypothetical protein
METSLMVIAVAPYLHRVLISTGMLLSTRPHIKPGGSDWSLTLPPDPLSTLSTILQLIHCRCGLDLQ